MPIDVGLLQEIRVTLNRCRVLGTERFKDAIEATLARTRPAGESREAEETVQGAGATRKR